MQQHTYISGVQSFYLGPGNSQPASVGLSTAAHQIRHTSDSKPKDISYIVTASNTKRVDPNEIIRTAELLGIKQFQGGDVFQGPQSDASAFVRAHKYGQEGPTLLFGLVTEPTGKSTAYASIISPITQQPQAVIASAEEHSVTGLYGTKTVELALKQIKSDYSEMRRIDEIMALGGNHEVRETIAQLQAQQYGKPQPKITNISSITPILQASFRNRTPRVQHYIAIGPHSIAQIELNLAPHTQNRISAAEIHTINKTYLKKYNALWGA